MIIMSLFLIGLLSMCGMLLFVGVFAVTLLIDWIMDMCGIKKKPVDKKED